MHGPQADAAAPAEALWLTEQDVVGLLTLGEAIDALECSVVAEHYGEARTMGKTMLQYGRSNLHALGGQLGGLVGTKSWVHAEAGTCPLLLLWDAHGGQLLAVIEAFALGNLRTGATSGLATRWLAAPGATVAAIVGTGKQALAQVAALAAVRPLERVLVYGRDAGRRAAFAERVESVLGLRAEAAATLHEATAEAEVLTLATRASEAFLRARDLRPGAHLNAIGAIGPDREEFFQDVFDAASVVCVDSLPAAQQLSREFITRYAGRGWETVRTLGQVVAERPCGSARGRGGITLFKAMGMGLSDVALGAAVLEKARAAGIGRTIEQPKKAALRYGAPAVA